MATLPTLPDTPFYAAILRGIGAPVTGNTLALLYAWRQTEGGKATYNPLNTTWKRPGSLKFNSRNVQSYLTPQDGVFATVNTLRDPQYASIVAALQSDKPPEEVGRIIIASPWGTRSLLLDVISMFARGRVVVAPIPAIPGAPPMSSLEPVAPKSETRPAPAAASPRWWLLASAVTLAVALVIVPAFLLPKSVPALPPPPKSNPRRRRRR